MLHYAMVKERQGSGTIPRGSFDGCLSPGDKGAMSEDVP